MINYQISLFLTLFTISLRKNNAQLTIRNNILFKILNILSTIKKRHYQPYIHRFSNTIILENIIIDFFIFTLNFNTNRQFLVFFVF